MGAEEDAHYHVDRIGTESGGGGLSTSLRDLARFGETIRNHGRFNGRQIVPSQVVEDIARGGDPAKFKPAGYTTLPGASYRNQWWTRTMRTAPTWRAAFTGRASISIRRPRW